MSAILQRTQDARGGERIVVFEETGEERRVVRECKSCGRSFPNNRGEGIVSPAGLEHVGVEYGFTACGHDATGDDWWWPL